MTLLTMTRGDTQTFRVDLLDAEGAPLALDGLTLTFTVKKHYDDADDDAIIVKESGAGIELLEDDGAAEITIDPEDTIDIIRPREYVWDLQVDDAGDIRTPLAGLFRVRRDVTHGSGAS